MYDNVRALVMISGQTMVVLIGEKSFICGRTVKLNGQSETFEQWAAIGDAFISIP